MNNEIDYASNPDEWMSCLDIENTVAFPSSTNTWVQLGYEGNIMPTNWCLPSIFDVPKYTSFSFPETVTSSISLDDYITRNMSKEQINEILICKLFEEIKTKILHDSNYSDIVRIVELYNSATCSKTYKASIKLNHDA